MEETNTLLEWRRSDFCGNSACVEVAQDAEAFLVRDSKNPSGSVLTFDRAEWDAFVAGVRAGNFDFQ
jgi:predicted secreted Zn-dependent protease